MSMVALSAMCLAQHKAEQEPKPRKIHLLHANTLSFNKAEDAERKTLRGDVRFRQDSCYMYCDSAYFYETTNSMSAFGHVRMEQGDTLYVYCDSMDYNGDTMYGQLYDHVHLIHRSKTTNTNLYTDYLTYDRSTEEANYPETGVIVDSLVHLRSQIGWYYPNSRLAFLQYDVEGRTYERDSVWKSMGGMPPHTYKVDDSKLVPHYYLYSDTLRYDFNENLAKVMGPSRIINDSTIIHTRMGQFNTQTEQANLYLQSWIESPHRYATGRQLYYDAKNKIGEAKGNVVAVDTLNCIKVTGDYGYYIDNDSVPQMGFVTGHALAMEYSSGDTLFLHADTLKAYTTLVLVPADTIYVEDLLALADSIQETASLPEQTLSQLSDTVLMASPDSTVVQLPDSVVTAPSDPIVAQLPDTLLATPSDSTVVQLPDSALTAPSDLIVAQQSDSLRALKTDSTALEKKTPAPVAEVKAKTIDHIIPARYDSLRYMQAYHGVRYYRSDIQGVCDSLIYSVRDSLATFMGNPVMWNSKYQITGDTIFAIVLRQGIQRAMIHPNAFLAQSHDETLTVDMDTLTELQKQQLIVDTLHYDQISGADLVCFFEDGKVRKMDMKGNVQIIYYAEESDRTMIGLNQMIGNYFTTWFKDQRMEKSVLWPDVVASLTPIQLVTDDILYQEGFRWMAYLRPYNSKDVFREIEMKEEDKQEVVKLFDDDELNGY